jgi:hypothetical protein
LVLGCGGNVEVDGEVREEGSDVAGAELARVACAMEADVASDPVDIAVFGAARVMLAADHGTDLVEQFGLR